MISFLQHYYLFILIFLLFVIIRYQRLHKKKRPIYKKFYNFQIIEYTLLILFIIIILLHNSDLSKFISEKENFSELSTISGVLAGFIFAGVSVLYSFIGNNQISSKFKNDFMDHVFAKLFLSILFSILVILIYVIFLIFPDLVEINYVKTYITIFLISFFYFIWGLYEIYRFLNKLKTHL